MQTTKLIKFMQSVFMFSKNKIQEAKARMFLAEHRTHSKWQNNQSRHRPENYRRPKIRYIKDGYETRVCRNLALVLKENGQAIIL